MKFTSTLLSLAFAASSLASPTPETSPKPLSPLEERAVSPYYRPTPVLLCLLPSQANNIANAFKWLLANPNAPNFATSAKALFASNFVDYSDSVNQLIGVPAGAITYSGEDAWIAGSGAQPPLTTNTLQIFYGCKDIAWRWVSTSGAGNDNIPIKGINTFTVNLLGQITTVNSEFNNLGWYENTGHTCSA